MMLVMWGLPEVRPVSSHPSAADDDEDGDDDDALTTNSDKGKGWAIVECASPSRVFNTHHHHHRRHYQQRHHHRSTTTTITITISITITIINPYHLIRPYYLDLLASLDQRLSGALVRAFGSVSRAEPALWS